MWEGDYPVNGVMQHWSLSLNFGNSILAVGNVAKGFTGSELIDCMHSFTLTGQSPWQDPHGVACNPQPTMTVSPA